MSKTKTGFFNWQNLLKFETLLCLLCILTLGFGGYLIYLGKLINLSDQIRYFGFSFGIMSIMHAAKQFQANHDWNRRQLAITSAKEIKAEMNKHLFVLDETFRYGQRKKTTPITLDEIHAVICKKNTAGKFEIDHSDGAKKIRKAMLHILNGFEYLAVGIYQGVFDQGIIEAFYRGPIIKCYQVFGSYIEHYNTEMFPERGGKVWEHLKHLATDLEAKEAKVLEKRKGADQ